MEVAVSKSAAFPCFILLGLVLLLGTGCADVITYSRDAQRHGMTLYNEGNYADAAGAFHNSVRQNPQNYEGYYYLGNCYEKLGQYQQAVAAYRTAQQTINLSVEGKYDDETRSKILNGLASTIAVGDPRNIELDALQKEAEAKKSGENWYIIAKVYAQRGDADSAIDSFNRATLLQPTNFNVAKEFGLYLERIGQTQRAEATLRKAYTMNHQDTEVAAALRRLGIIPGPSMKDDLRLDSPSAAVAPTPSTPSASPAPTVQAPRD